MKLQDTKDKKILDVQRETTGFILKTKNSVGIKLRTTIETRR